MPNISSSGTTNTAILKDLLAEAKERAEAQLDVLERIQQQLAKMNEDENLSPGERHYE